MHLDTWADVSIVVFMAIFSLIAVGALVVMAIAVSKLQQAVNSLATKVEPIVIKASDTLDTVHRVTVTVGAKADSILTRGEALTDNVSQNVEKTATVVQNTVTTPLINLSSLISGVSKGFTVWGHSATHHGPTSDDRKVKAAKP